MMPRKKALQEAIRFISDNNGDQAVIDTLQDLCNSLPLIRWNDKTIKDSVDYFILENDRVPNATDFEINRTLPPHSVIKHIYGIPLREWLSLNYGVHSKTEAELKDIHSQKFKEEYMKIRPSSQMDYQKRKSKGTTAWQTVAKYYGVSSWRATLKVLGLPLYTPVRSRKKTIFNVKVYTDLEK